MTQKNEIERKKYGEGKYQASALSVILNYEVRGDKISGKVPWNLRLDSDDFSSMKVDHSL